MEQTVTKFFIVSIVVVILNMPFGYWRANEKKFSRGWFLAVHIPVPFIIALRLLSGLGWHFITFPIMISSFFIGQFLGGRILHWRKMHNKEPLTSCFVWDLIKSYHISRNNNPL
ncbi:MAG: hypothetical protein M1381_07570 [Deltaproteobacteria bacterium]|nr:hypothetical protein [Deltaproteobacteria bacterium]MCL5792573.1 hypothetical protein [Deltaproteobacteria bacterium]